MHRDENPNLLGAGFYYTKKRTICSYFQEKRLFRRSTKQASPLSAHSSDAGEARGQVSLQLTSGSWVDFRRDLGID